MENKDYEELFRKSLLTIRKLKKNITDSKNQREKIAIIGMACRFPGGSDTPENFWKLISEGRSSEIQIPDNRFDLTDYYDPVPGKAGKMYVRQGSFLDDDISEFDAKFFGISGAEAKDMDPQQRLLCEVSWEAFENAGQDVQELKGSRTGVFLGISSVGEYSKLPRDASKVNQYTGTGNTSSIASGRLSYIFGFHGPSISLDTACSSSLVSTHLAANSLAERECDLALSAGVSLMISPEVMSSLCAMNALAVDGKSKPFDEGANGYGRGEGCGVIILKRLTDAIRDHDNIYAVIEGSAINNDGESSSLTVPNGIAQQRVIQDALKNAGVSPDEIDYIEAHGTGTLLGDPIEFDAIKEVFLSEKNQRETDLKIGAVKGNIGHLEAAAGIAGIMKAALCLEHNKLVKIANLQNLNPRVKPEGFPVEFVTECKDWNSNGQKPKRVGISSFGFSGTNAHMVLCEPPELGETATELPHYLLCMSAKTEQGVVELVKRYKDMFEREERFRLLEVCYTANKCRGRFAHCVTVLGKDKQDFLNGFDNILSLYKEKKTIYIEKTQLAGSSEGEDRLNAKRRIYEQIDAHTFSAHIDLVIQPKFIFVFHDDGKEIVEAAKEVYHIIPAYKKTLDVYLKIILKMGVKDEFTEYKAMENDVVSEVFLLAVYVALADFFSAMGVHCEAICGQKAGEFAAAVIAKIMSFDTAVSSIMSHYEGKRESGIAKARIHRPAVRYLCGLTSSVVSDIGDLHEYFNKDVYKKDGAYIKSIHALYGQGYRFFLEFGKKDRVVQEILQKEDVVPLKVLSGNDALGSLLEVLARSIMLGCHVSWGKFFEGMDIKKTLLPTYPFAKEKHWIDKLPKETVGFGVPKPTEKFNAVEIMLPSESRQYQFLYCNSNFREAQDNSGVIHMGYYLEMIQNVMNKQYPDKEYVIERMEFISAIMLLDEEVREVIIVLEPEGGKLLFQIYNKKSSQRDWNRNMKGSIAFCSGREDKVYDLENVKQSCMGRQMDGAVFYEPLEKAKGFFFGHAVRWVQEACCSDDAAYVKFRNMDEDDVTLKYNIGVHPGILDACAQICNFISADYAPNEKKYMVRRMDNVRIYPWHYIDDNVSAFVRFNGFYEKKGEIICCFMVFNEIGEIIVETGGIWLREFDEMQLGMINAMMETVHHGAGQDTVFLMKFMQASAEQKQDVVSDYVVAVMAEALGEDPKQLDLYEPIDNLGLDSMSGLDFYNRITDRLGVEMPFSQLAQCKNIKDCASKVCDKLLGKQEENDGLFPLQEQDFSLSAWIHNYREMPNVRARIFCFPNGFRSADMFDSWQEQLGDEIQVCPVKIPGMDISRINEKAPIEVDEFTETFIRVLEQGNLLDVPCASFGHSWGALFSYRLGYYLDKREDVNYIKLFVSGYTSPARKNTSVEKILDEIKNQGFHSIPIYEEIKNDKEAVGLIVRSFQKVWGYDEKGTRAVLNLLLSATGLIDRYEFNPKETLKVPIVAYHGIDDYVVNIDEMNLWEGLSAEGFKLYTMKGDHQFVNENQSEKQLLETLKEEIVCSL